MPKAMKRVLVCTVALAASMFAASVAAAPSPVSPLSTTKLTTVHPVFQWRLGPGEVSESISIASSPALAATGEFAAQNQVALDSLQADAKSHTFDQPIPAGHYWWHVASHDTSVPAPAPHLFSPAQPFTLSPSVTKLKVSLRFAGRSFLATVSYQANVATVLVKGRLLAGSKRLAQRSDKSTTLVGQPGSSMAQWDVPSSVKRGTALKLTVTVSIPGSTGTATATKTFKAP